MGAAAVPIMMGVGTGASLIGANKAAKGAKAVGNAQLSAAQESAQVQREAMQQTRAASEPFRFGAQQSINPLLSMMGLPSVQMPQQPLFNQYGEMAQPAQDDPAARINELRRKIAALEQRLIQ